MNSIKMVKTHLNNLEFNLNEINGKEAIDVKITDKITIKEIKENIVIFDVTRLINFTSLENSYISVTFKNILQMAETTNKDEFINCIKSNVPLLSSVIFSKISLSISNITNLSVLGTIITPPVYDINGIEIN